MPALEHGTPVQIERRSPTSTARSAPCCRARWPSATAAGLPEDTIHVALTGTAGQAFGAFLAQGITLDLLGEANDYVGKGMSGGKHHRAPTDKVGYDAGTEVDHRRQHRALRRHRRANATSAASPASASRCATPGPSPLSRARGDHGCEYMTGGLVVVIGETGRNFAAGMSGGVAYVLDEDGTFRSRCNLAMVDLEPVQEEEDLMREIHHHGGDLEWHGRVDISGDMTRHDDERCTSSSPTICTTPAPAGPARSWRTGSRCARNSSR
jgi:glutamate synthase (NADPH/NADH) large chain